MNFFQADNFEINYIYYKIYAVQSWANVKMTVLTHNMHNLKYYALQYYDDITIYTLCRNLRKPGFLEGLNLRGESDIVDKTFTIFWYIF